MVLLEPLELRLEDEEPSLEVPTYLHFMMPVSRCSTIKGLELSSLPQGVAEKVSKGLDVVIPCNYVERLGEEVPKDIAELCRGVDADRFYIRISKD